MSRPRLGKAMLEARQPLRADPPATPCRDRKGLKMNDFSLLDLFFTMLWFYLIVVWIYFLITLMGDIFRSRDLSGFSKTLWMLFLIFVPFVAAITYLIVRGDQMRQRQIQDMADREDELRRRLGVTQLSTADELTKLTALRDSGVLSEDEYQTQRGRLLVG
jgi:hypothetical protein